jgi:Protein of unknown function (DUF3810)
MKRILIAILGWLAALGLLWVIFPIPAATIESLYSRQVFPRLAWLIIGITDIFPFSVAGLVLLVVPIALILWIARAIRQKNKNILWQIPLGCLALYGMFVLNWGANYRRENIETLLQLEPNKVADTDIQILLENLLIILQLEHLAPRDKPQAFAAIRSSIGQQLEKITNTTPTIPTQVKATPNGLLLMLETSGVVSPITLEAHVDNALPEPFFLAITAHELVHTTGIAGEADTDLIAAIAGLNSSNAYTRYCIALTYFARILGDANKKLQTELIKKLPQQAKTDYAALRKAQEAHRNPLLASASQTVYNQYLKSQGVEAGVKDYSRIGRLLAAAQTQGLIFR